MSEIHHSPIQQAQDQLKHLSDDEETRWRAQAREKALHDEASFLASARREGLAEGLEQGLERGLEQGREEGLQAGEVMALRRLLAKRFGPLPADIEERVNQASLEQIEAWFDQAIGAASLEAVFDKDGSTP